MKLKEIVELVQQHHPNLGAQEVVKMVNRAQMSTAQEQDY